MLLPAIRLFPITTRATSRMIGNLHASPLAAGAIERRTPRLHDALDLPFAAGTGARLTLASVDGKIVLEHAEFAVGALVIAQRRAARLHRLAQHRLDRRRQQLDLVGPHL